MDDSDTTSLCTPALAHFGREIIEEARDWPIQQLDRIVDGNAVAPGDVVIQEEVARLGPEARDLIKRLIPEIVDLTLHHVMFMFEHPTHHGIRISVTLPSGETCADLEAISDGLAGDLLYWREAFSKQRYKTFPEAEVEAPNLEDLDAAPPSQEPER